jgi:methylase of polypeptide subunit release factors
MTISSDQQFNANAEKYAASHVHKFGPSLPVLLELAQPNTNDRALDVATGTGNTALTIAPFVSSVIGLDMAVKMLEQAKKRALEDLPTQIFSRAALKLCHLITRVLLWWSRGTHRIIFEMFRSSCLRSCAYSSLVVGT